jgi:hypothetical protein
MLILNVYLFFDKELGDISDITHLLGIGQCNDAYSAIQRSYPGMNKKPW